jgi:hypothetical protein
MTKMVSRTRLGVALIICALHINAFFNGIYRTDESSSTFVACGCVTLYDYMLSTAYGGRISDIYLNVSIMLNNTECLKYISVIT